MYEEATIQLCLFAIGSAVCSCGDLHMAYMQGHNHLGQGIWNLNYLLVKTNPWSLKDYETSNFWEGFCPKIIKFLLRSKQKVFITVVNIYKE